MICSSGWWFVLYHGPPQPSLPDRVMSPAAAEGGAETQSCAGALKVKIRSILNKEQEHPLPFPTALCCTQTSQPKFPFLSPNSWLREFWWASLSYSRSSWERLKCPLLIFVVIKKVEQENQRGLHLDYFQVFNVWMHYVKNEISEKPGDGTFWF